MKRILIAPLLLLALCASLNFSGPTASGVAGDPAIYYVDATGGDDGNDGLSTGAAWQTVAKVNGSAFNAGDSILFKRGETWREKLTPPSSGSAGNVITFGAYGTGADPIFDGSVIKDNADFSIHTGTGGDSERVPDYGLESWSSSSNLALWTEIAVSGSTVEWDAVDLRPGTHGSYSAKITIDADGSAGGLRNTMSLTPGSSYDISLWYKTEAGKTAYLKIYDTGANVSLKSDGTWQGDSGAFITLVAATSWTEYTLTFSANASYSGYTILLSRFNATSSIIHFDDVSIFGPSPVFANVYSASWAAGTYIEPMVWENDARLSRLYYVDAVDLTPGSFYYDDVTNTVYVHASNSSNVITNGEVYELPALTENIDDNGRDYLSFSDLTATKTHGNDNNTLGGIILSGSHNTLTDCTSNNHRRHALTFYTGADNCLATGCTLSDSAITSPVAFFGTGTEDNVLAYSDVQATCQSQPCVRVHGSGAADNIIEHCTLHSGAYRVTSVEVYGPGVSGTIVRYNSVHGVGNYFVRATIGHTGLKVYYNIVDATDFDLYSLVSLDASTDNEVYNNTFYNAAQYALQQTGNSTGTLFKNNIVYGSKYVSVEDGSETDSAYDYNLYYNAAGTPLNWRGTDYNFADWKTNSSQDAHSLNVDPLFNSATDFRLRINSPARQKGVNVSLTLDRAGSKVPAWAGKLPDIGAYEMRPGGIIIR